MNLYVVCEGGSDEAVIGYYGDRDTALALVGHDMHDLKLSVPRLHVHWYKLIDKEFIFQDVLHS